MTAAHAFVVTFCIWTGTPDDPCPCPFLSDMGTIHAATCADGARVVRAAARPGQQVLVIACAPASEVASR
jgi:hypothetical protein